MAQNQQSRESQAYAIDCEMVCVEDTTRPGKGKQYPIQAVIVDESYAVVFNKYIRPQGRVINDNSFVHGINPASVISQGIPLERARQEIYNILNDSIVVGHDLENDLRSLGLHKVIPSYDRHDTATASMFLVRQPSPGNGWQKPSLKNLAWHYLGKAIQKNIHDPIEDATIAMMLHNKFKLCPPGDWAPPGGEFYLPIGH